jgi:dolichyl-phosphate beta-glucosyltransferase
MTPEETARNVELGLIVLLAIAFIYVLCVHYISDVTIYDLMLRPSTDPASLPDLSEPSSDIGDHAGSPSCIFNPAEVHLSVVIPAHNEELSILRTIEQIVDYLSGRRASESSFTWEVIVVDDGSADRTSDVLKSSSLGNRELRLLRLPVQMGKGAAVQFGSLHSRGRLILTMDANGGIDISQFGSFEDRFGKLCEIDRNIVIVGFRNNRGLLSRAFHGIASFAGIGRIRDSQCPFKLFSREAARWLFTNQHVRKYCFDVELLYIAGKRGMLVAEVPVQASPRTFCRVGAMLQMAVDVVQIGVLHRLGLWSVRMKADIIDTEYEA